MSNYTTVKAKITAVKTAQEELRVAKADTKQAQAEVEQAQATLDSLNKKLAAQQAVGNITDAERDKAAAEVTMLEAKRADLKSRKNTLISERDDIQDMIDILEDPSPSTAGSIAEVQVDINLYDVATDYDEKVLIRLNNDKASATNSTENTADLAAANSAAAAAVPPTTFTAPSGASAYTAADGRAKMKADLKDILDEIVILQKALAVMEAELARTPDPTPGQLQDIDDQRDAIEAKVVLRGDKEAEIAAADAAIAIKQSDVTQGKNHLKERTMAKRVLQKQLADHRANKQAKVDELSKVTNDLQMIEGSALTEDASLTVPAAGSQLKIATDIRDTYAGNYTDQQTVISSIETAISAETTVLNTKNADLVAKKTTEDTKQDAYNLAKQSLDNALKTQVEYEVKAAVKVIAEMLKYQNVTLASAPTVDPTVQLEVDKTFTSSRVRLVFEQMKAALSDPVAYKALLAKIMADPVAVFFSGEADPDLSDLSAEDVEKFRKQIRDMFGPEARRVLGRGGSSNVTTTPSSSSDSGISPILIILLFALVALAVLYFSRR